MALEVVGCVVCLYRRAVSAIVSRFGLMPANSRAAAFSACVVGNSKHSSWRHVRKSTSVIRTELGQTVAAPLAAFFVEVAYGVFCWRVYQGSRGLLALIVIGNLANLSFLSPAIPGPESYLAGHPLLVVTVVFVQIVVTLALVGVLAGRNDFKSPAATLHLGRRISMGRASSTSE